MCYMSVVVCRWMNDVTRTRSHRNGCPVVYTWFQWTGANLNIAAPCSRHTRSQIYFKSGYNFSFLISSPCSVKRQWKSMLKTSLSTMFNTVSFVWPLFNPLYGPLVSRPGPPCNTAGAPLYPGQGPLVSRWFRIHDFNLTCGVQKRREVGVRC